MMVIPWKLANQAGDPTISVLILLGVAAIANTAFVVGQRLSEGTGGLRVGRLELLVAASLAGFTLLGNLASGYAIQDLSPALLNVLLRADVLIVALLGWPLLGETVERRFWLGAGVALIGLGVLQGPLGEAGWAGLLAGGTGMAIGAAACFSSLAIVTRRFIHRIDPVAVNAMRLWLAVALWFPFNRLPDWSAIPQEQWLYASISAIAGPFLGRLALMIAARHIEARVSTLATLTTPAWTLVFAIVLLSDWPAPHELLGGAIMLLGIAVPFVRFGEGRSARASFRR